MIYRLLALFLIIGFSNPTFSSQGIYITGGKGHYAYRNKIRVVREQSIYGAYNPSIHTTLQQEATDFVSEGSGIQGGLGYRFAKHYHLELTGLSYSREFNKYFDQEENSVRPKPKYQLIHTIQGGMLIAQRTLFQVLHPRITVYGGGGIGALGQSNEGFDHNHNTLESPEQWSILGIVKYGIQCRIMHTLIIDLNHTLSIKAYHIVNRDKEGNIHTTPFQPNPDKFGFFTLRAHYHWL